MPTRRQPTRGCVSSVGAVNKHPGASKTGHPRMGTDYQVEIPKQVSFSETLGEKYERCERQQSPSYRDERTGVIVSVPEKPKVVERELAKPVERELAKPGTRAWFATCGYPHHGIRCACHRDPTGTHDHDTEMNHNAAERFAECEDDGIKRQYFIPDDGGLQPWYYKGRKKTESRDTATDHGKVSDLERLRNGVKARAREKEPNKDTVANSQQTSAGAVKNFPVFDFNKGFKPEPKEPNKKQKTRPDSSFAAVVARERARPAKKGRNKAQRDASARTEIAKNCKK